MASLEESPDGRRVQRGVAEGSSTGSASVPAYQQRRTFLEEERVKRDGGLHWCHRCEEWLIGLSFDEDVLSHASSGERKRLCKDCQHLGYSPKDLHGYECSGGHSCGHLFFDPASLKNWKAKHSSTLTCVVCSKCGRGESQRKYKCDACGERKETAAYDAYVLEHARKHDRKRVCEACQDLGYSPKDTTHYMCKEGHQRGHLHFAPQALKDAKRRPSYHPLCNDCSNLKLGRDVLAAKEEGETPSKDGGEDDAESPRLLTGAAGSNAGATVDAGTETPDAEGERKPQAVEAPYKCDYCHLGAQEGDSKVNLACLSATGQTHVCIDCRASGWSPKDLDDYWCSGCRGRRGHLEFMPLDALKARLTRNWNSVGYCKICLSRAVHPDVETPAARRLRISAAEAAVARASASAASQRAPK